MSPKEHLKAAADLRRVALWHELQAQDAARSRTRSRPLHPLGDTAIAAMKVIDQKPGMFGQAIANAAGCSYGHFRNEITPILKSRGYVQIRGLGFCPPDHFVT